MKNKLFFLIALLMLVSAGMTSAQVVVRQVAEPNPATDTDIVIYNSFFDRPNNKSGWIYDPSSSVSGPYRDLGQTFKPAQSFSLDKIVIAISPYTTQENLNACNRAPVHVDIYRFPSINEMEAPVDTLSSQAGHLPDNMILNVTQFLEFDLQQIVPLSPGFWYGFLLKFDSLKVQRMLEIVKSEDGDYYPNGKMLYTEFNGSDGRTNITVYKWKHAGGNANRDLHFWLKKSSASAVQVLAASPAEYALLPNYPNPFNASTAIGYRLARPAYVNLAVYDLQGDEVRVLKHEMMQAGAHSLIWDGCNQAGAALPSGVYFVRMQCDAFSALRKVTVLR